MYITTNQIVVRLIYCGSLQYLHDGDFVQLQKYNILLRSD